MKPRAAEPVLQAERPPMYFMARRSRPLGDGMSRDAIGWPIVTPLALAERRQPRGCGKGIFETYFQRLLETAAFSAIITRRLHVGHKLSGPHREFVRIRFSERTGAGTANSATRFMRGVTKGGVLTIALAALAKPVVADTQLNCSTKKVVIISAPGGETSSTREEDLSFRVDDAAKTLTFAGDGPLADYPIRQLLDQRK